MIDWNQLAEELQQESFSEGQIKELRSLVGHVHLNALLRLPRSQLRNVLSAETEEAKLERLKALLSDLTERESASDLESMRAAHRSPLTQHPLDRGADSARPTAETPLAKLQLVKAALVESVGAFPADAEAGEKLLQSILALGSASGGGDRIEKPFDYGLAMGLVAAGGPQALSQSCIDDIRTQVSALQTGFASDIASQIKDLRATRTADEVFRASTTRSRLSRSDAVGEDARSPPRGSPFGRGMSPDGRPDPGLPSDWGSPMPDPPRPDPLGPEPQPEAPTFCEQVANLVRQAYLDWASGANEDPFARLIGDVKPKCVAFNVIDNTTFKVTPTTDLRFSPSRPANVRLYFGDEDITHQIESWNPDEIAFKLPSGVTSSRVYLQGHIPSASVHGPIRDAVLDRVRDLIGGNVRQGPGVPIGVIYPAAFLVLRFNGIDVTEASEVFDLQACRDPASLFWQVGMERHHVIGVPSCATLKVRVLDEQGNVIADNPEPVGGSAVPPSTTGESWLEVLAAVSLNGSPVGSEAKRRVRIRRQKRLRLEMQVPEKPQLIGSQRGVVRAHVSCRAEVGGLEVKLQSLAPQIVSVPNAVRIPEGQNSIDFFAFSNEDQFGTAKVLAKASGHADAEIEIAVLEPHTAIILSGGGSKGDFQVGALAYILRHEWNSLGVKSIIGTSVGSINAIGLAHNSGQSTERLIEDQWLALRRNADMYVVSEWLQRLEAYGGDLIRPLIRVLSDWDDESSNAGIALPVSAADVRTLILSAQLGNIIFPVFGAAMAFGLARQLLEHLIELLELFTAYLDGHGDEVLANLEFKHWRKIPGNENKPASVFWNDRTIRYVAAASVLELEPAKRRLEQSINMQEIGSGGMQLRLCMVALQDGQVYYVDERGMLLHDANGKQLPEEIVSIAFAPEFSATSGDLRGKLVAAAMGSSAIPTFFAPVRIATPNRTLTMVDGGVREVLPTSAAMDLGARLMVCIAADRAEDPHEAFEPLANLFDIGKRGLSLQGSEVAKEDRLAPQRACRGDLETILIEPINNALHSAFTIDPALIRISMAYGFMRAFDAFRGREYPFERIDLTASTQVIVHLRYECYELEKQFLSGPNIVRGWFFGHSARGHGQIRTFAFLPDELAVLRAKKLELFQWVLMRFNRWGQSSLPKHFGSPGSGRDEKLSDWWEHWETIDPRLIDSVYWTMNGKPFDQQQIFDRSAPGSRRMESTQPRGPVVPNHFAIAMLS